MPGIQGMGRPDDIQSPIPNEQIDMNNVAKVPDIANMPGPQGLGALLPQQSQQEEGPKLDDLFGSSSQASGPNLDDLFGPSEPTSEGHAGFGARVAAGFASNEEEKLAYIKKEYGDANVRKGKDGNPEVKHDGKWVKFNNDWFGIGDPANLGRQAVVEAGALPAEILAGTTAAGETMTGIGAPAALPTMAAGRVAGGAMGEYAARYAASKIGIPRLEKTDKEVMINDALAAGTQGGVRAVFGHIFDKIISSGGIISGAKSLAKDMGLAKESSVEAMEALSAPMRNQTAAIIEQQKGDWTNKVGGEDKVASHVKDAVETERAARAAGIDLTPEELFPNNVDAQQVSRSALNSKKMQEWKIQRGEVITNAVEDWQKVATKGKPNELVPSLSGASESDKLLGSKIGFWRKRAITESGDQLVSMSDSSTDKSFKNGFRSAAQKFGFLNEDGQSQWNYAVRPVVDDLAESLDMPAEKVEWLHRFMVNTNDKLTNGKDMMSLKEADQMYYVLSRKINNALDSHGNLKDSYSKDYVGSLIEMKNGIRDSFTSGVGKFLGEKDQALYQADVKAFAKMQEPLEEMSRLFENEAPSLQHTIAFITKDPAKANGRIEAMKMLFGKEKPEVIDNLRSAYWEYLKNNHSFSEGSIAKTQMVGDINASKLLKTLQPGSSQREVFETMFGEKQTIDMTNMMKAINAVQANYSGKEVNPSNMFSRIWKAGGSLIKANPEVAADIFSSNAAVNSIIDSEGRNKLLNAMTEKERSYAVKVFSAMQNVGMAGVGRIPNILSQDAAGAMRNRDLPK